MSDEKTPRSKALPWRTITVAFFGLLLVFQGFLSFVVVPEPYPAIRMPQFGRAAASDGTLQVSIIRAEVVNQDGSILRVSPGDLMSDFRASSAGPSFDYLFSPGKSERITPAVKQWLTDKISEVDGGKTPTELRICFRASRVSAVDATILSQKPCEWTVIEL